MSSPSQGDGRHPAASGAGTPSDPIPIRSRESTAEPVSQNSSLGSGHSIAHGGSVRSGRFRAQPQERSQQEQVSQQHQVMQGHQAMQEHQAMQGHQAMQEHQAVQERQSQQRQQAIQQLRALQDQALQQGQALQQHQALQHQQALQQQQVWQQHQALQHARAVQQQQAWQEQQALQQQQAWGQQQAWEQQALQQHHQQQALQQQNPQYQQMGSSRTNSGVPQSVLPGWQPDNEVSHCPICGQQFGMFNRRHHCRKCGRVVCNACSPHRIIIPHQYIVRAPWDPTPAEVYSSGLAISGSIAQFAGGERVRLCNPCVPDPNIAPPQATGGHSRAHSGSLLPSGPEGGDPVRSRRATWVGTNHGGSPMPNALPGRALPAAPAVMAQPVRQDPPAPAANPYRAHLLDILAGGSHLQRPLPPVPHPQGQQGRASASTSQPQPQGYRFAEEDECPVCHGELPSRTLPNVETLREEHIQQCIISHSSYSRGGAGSSASGAQGASGGQDFAAQPRRTGLIRYIATEKDCAGDDRECSICMEDYEVGVGMARLECLCRFHQACIERWFDAGHAGRCPVHQHSEFGY